MAIAEYNDLLSPYDKGHRWRKDLTVGFFFTTVEGQMISLEKIRQTMDLLYPQPSSVQSLAGFFSASLQDTQLALDSLAASRFVYYDEAGKSYLSAIRFTENELETDPLPPSTIAAKVRFSPTLVEAQLQRLVLLGRAKLVQAPITGEKQYARV
jgi:hypothetical protein